MKTASHVLHDILDLLCSESRGGSYTRFVVPENPLSPSFFFGWEQMKRTRRGWQSKHGTATKSSCGVDRQLKKIEAAAKGKVREGRNTLLRTVTEMKLVAPKTMEIPVHYRRRWPMIIFDDTFNLQLTTTTPQSHAVLLTSVKLPH